MHVNGGWGLAPALFVPKQIIHANLNIYEMVYIPSNKVWRIGNMDFAKALHGGEVRGSNPTNSIKILINKP